MGHRHTSAQLCGHGEIFRAGRGVAETLSARAAEGKVAGDSVKRLERGSSLGFVRATRLTLLGLLRVYQILLSPFFGGACKFYPSCSNYALEAIERHGARRGIVLTLKRLGRCRPFTKGGFDPVPEPEAEREERILPTIEEPAR